MRTSLLGRVVTIMVIAAVVAGGPAPAFADPPAAAGLMPGAGQYVPLNGARIVTDADIATGGTYSFTPVGRGGVPASGVSAVAFTMTTRSAGSGHLIVYPAGSTVPGTSNLNYRPNLPITNSVTVAVGGGGQVSVRNAGTTDATSLWVDVIGYYTATAQATTGSTYVPLTPDRLVNGVDNAAGGTLLVDPLGRGGVPTSNVSAVLVNILVRGSGTAGTASAYPDGISRPVWTAVNYQGDYVYNNQVSVKLGTGGRFRVFTTTATTVYIDVVGYYQTSAGNAAGSALNPTPLTRLTPVILESRATHTFSPLGRAGIPASGVAGVLFNLTATQTTAVGAIIVFPSGATRPATNNLSYRSGGAWPTLQRAKLGSDGQVSIYNGSDSSVRLLIDLAGYYRAAVAPAAPTAVAATAGDGSAVVTWTPPANDGGANITGYRVTANPGGSTVDVVGTVKSAPVAGLTNGTAYRFTVSAVNAAGRSAVSPESTAVTPLAATVPGAPTAVTAQARHTSALVTWQRPVSDGRLPIDAYTVTASPGGAVVTVSGLTTEALVPNLANGTAYTFTVAAINGRGTGPASPPTSPVRPGLTPPQAPMTVIAGATATGQITVEWTSPRYDGGQPITGYTITASPGGRRVDAAADAFEADVTGLTAGTGYTFTVVARNPAGTSEPSAPTTPVTPDFALAPGARELSSAALATLTAVEAGAVRFTNAPAEVTGLPAGAVLLVADPPAPHLPFLRRVSSVSTSGTTTTVSTTDAALPDAFTDGGFSVLAGMADIEADGTGTRAWEDVNELSIDTEIVPGLKVSGKATDRTLVQVEVGIGKKLKLTVERTVTIEANATADRSATIERQREEKLKGGKLKLKKLSKLAKLARPNLDVEWKLTARGSVHAGASAGFTVKSGYRFVIDIWNDERSAYGEQILERTVRVPTASADADLYLGMRMDATVTAFGFQVAKLKVTDEVRFHVDSEGDPWWTADFCGIVGIETFRVLGRTPYHNAERFKRCFALDRATGTLFQVRVSPSDSTIPRNGTVQFAGTSKVSPGSTITWAVEGAGNGTIDQTGRYTGPNKDGTFTVVASIPALGARPVQKGRAVVRIGTPGAPSLSVQPLPPLANGVTVVQFDIIRNGNPEDYFYVEVDPVEPGHDPGCAPWALLIGGSGTYKLHDVRGNDLNYRCYLMLAGHTYTFLVTAHNGSGASPTVRSNPVTILGAAPAPAGAGTGRVVGMGDG